MKKLIILLLVISMFSFSFSACAPREPQPPQDMDNGTEDQNITETIKLFYGDKNNEKIVSEERKITYSKEQDKYKTALEELIKGPGNKEFTANIHADTKVLGITKQNTDLIVDLSSEFNRFSGSVAEIIGVGSIVNTMTQFEDVERVKILVEGEELMGPNGEPRGFMGPFPLDPRQETIKEATLYFGDQNAMYVVPEKRSIRVSDDIRKEDYIKLVIEELVKGPQTEGLHPTIPAETKVLSVSIENHTAHIDFSEEMHTKHWGGAAGEAMTINSIANTVTEVEGIRQVKITVNGEPLAIEHTILEEPVGRNEDMIKK